MSTSRYTKEVQHFVYGEYSKGRRCRDIYVDVMTAWPELEGKLTVQGLTMMVGARKRAQKARGLSGNDLLMAAPAVRRVPAITLAGPEWSRRHVLCPA
jgi:hypothetical protein